MVSSPARTRASVWRDRLDRRQDADVEPGRVVVLQVLLDALRSRCGRRRALRSSQKIAACPVARARVTAASPSRGSAGPWSGTCARCRPASTRVLEQDVAGGVDHAHGAVARDLERLVVRAVLLGLLRHQADVRHGAHRAHVERAVRLAVVDEPPGRRRRSSDPESSPSCRAACRPGPTSGRRRGWPPASRRR